MRRSASILASDQSYVIEMKRFFTRFANKIRGTRRKKGNVGFWSASKLLLLYLFESFSMELKICKKLRHATVEAVIDEIYRFIKTKVRLIEFD